ncbi:uncharacterized protein LOC110168095 isoform X2 [Boleophthalmus pectinirostris]|uniref:uncharacterized protein LOC110168095 isoform X2 n=1 Tax=Boleophthalmus pectinirostris TaxID=150288 RepID=UPI00242A8B22|nr:uncharacterized protein LOC110168095 isoform X2 [Boleophthalmus pectinirostris]
MELQTEKRFQNLTLEQIQALDKVLTEVIPIYGRGNFPTLQVRAKDIIRVVKDRLMERDIPVKDIRLNGATASNVLEDFQVIKEVVLGSLRDLLPCGVNRRKITCLTMKEAYVQKMVKVFNEHDRWSLISLSNNRAKTVGLRFVSSLRRHFEFSVDSFQIILDRMLESYWESERRQNGQMTAAVKNMSKSVNESKEQEGYTSAPKIALEQRDQAKLSNEENPCKGQTKTEADTNKRDCKKQVLVPENNDVHLSSPSEEVTDIRGGNSQEDIVLCKENVEDKCQFHKDFPLASSKALFAEDLLVTHSCLKQSNNDPCESLSTQTMSLEQPAQTASKERDHKEEISQFKVKPVFQRTDDTNTTSGARDSHLEYAFPPPAKKSCSTSLEIVPPDTCPSPKLQRKMSRKLITKQQLPEKWSLLPDLSDLTTQLFPPIEIPKPLQQKPALMDNVQNLTTETLEGSGKTLIAPVDKKDTAVHERSATSDLSVKPKQSKKPPDLETCVIDIPSHSESQKPEPSEVVPGILGSPNLWTGSSVETTITVEAECMYGDFQQALHHLQNRLIATHHPEEIRGGGLLKYSDLLVRDFRPASDIEIKSLERYMCSRFFIDFPDVSEQQRKIEAYLQCHYIGSDEASKYDYLMTLRRVIDESTVCLMGHERRQTLNMITVLALRVLGEQNAIPNTANVTCFYQPAPYMTEPMYNSYFISQAQPPLVYHPYPLHVHLQSGLV